MSLNPNILGMVFETLQAWDEANDGPMVADSPRNHQGELRRLNLRFDPWLSLPPGNLVESFVIQLLYIEVIFTR